MLGSNSPESAAENRLANGGEAHSRDSVDGRLPQGSVHDDVEAGPTANTGEGSAEVLPALSSVHSERAAADSQMAAVVQPDRAAYNERDSAASPSQPRRSNAQQEQQRQQSPADQEIATTPGRSDGGAAAADGDAATPFDDVLSVLERIKWRQSTPFALAPGRQLYTSPVPFGGSEAPLQRSRLGSGSLTPHAGVGQRPGHQRLAPYSAQRPAAARQPHTPVPNGSFGGGAGPVQGVRFGTPQTGATAQEPLGRPQLGGLFAQTASTPAGTPRFGRRLGGALATSRPLAGGGRPLLAGSPLALPGIRGSSLSWTPMRGGAAEIAPHAGASPAAVAPGVSARGAKRGRPDDDAAGAADGGTPLLGSGWDAASERASAAKRRRPAERRVVASSLQPRALPATPEAPAEPAASPFSTNAARRILMALETMTQTPPQRAASPSAVLPPPTLSLGPPAEAASSAPPARSGSLAFAAAPEGDERRQLSQPPAQAIDAEPAAEAQPEEAPEPAAAATAAPSAGGGWGAALLSANKAAASAATAAVEAEIDRAKGGSKPEASQPTPVLSFGRPAGAPQPVERPTTPAEQPKVTLGDSTNVFETPRFSFGSKPADPKTKKVAKLVRGVPAAGAGSPGNGRAFRFGMPLEEQSLSPSPSSSPNGQAGEAFSLANQAAAAAAQLPLPPEDEAVAEASAPNAEASPNFASVDTSTAAAAPSTASGGGWGAALLQSNQAAASAAAAAVQAAIDDAAASGSGSSAAASAFKFGAKPAGDAGASEAPRAAARANGLFGFSAAPALAPPSLAFSFGAPSPQAGGTPASVGLQDAVAAAAASPPPASTGLGSLSGPPTFSFGTNSGAASFAFGASSAAAAGVDAAPAATGSASGLGAAAPSSSGGAAPLSFSFGAANTAAGEPGGSGAATPSIASVPQSFTLAASGAVPFGGGASGGTAATPLTATAPTFSFGAGPVPAAETPADNGGLQRQSSLGAASNMSMTSVDGAHGANSSSLGAADVAALLQPAAPTPSFSTFGSTQGAGFAFNSQTSPSTQFGNPSTFASAPSSGAGGFTFGGPSALAPDSTATAPAAFGASAFGSGASSAALSFGAGSPPAFGSSSAPYGGGGHTGVMAPAVPPQQPFGFSSSSNASAPAFSAGAFGAPAQQPAQQPGGFNFGAGGGTTAGGSTSLPAFSTTAFGVGASSQAGATMGAPQTGSMTLGAAPGEAGGAQRRKVKLRRPGRK